MIRWTITLPVKWIPRRVSRRGWLRCGPGSAAISCHLRMRRAKRCPGRVCCDCRCFQVSVGMAMVLLTGTLNRVMIVELSVPAWLVAIMVALPLVFAPFRALIGHRSDTHKSVLGWRRGPYIWFGSLLQFGGFAIMPFALLVSWPVIPTGRSGLAMSLRRWPFLYGWCRDAYCANSGPCAWLTI